MSLALIVRADQGGVGTQLWEIYRHVRPNKALILVDGERPRGAPRLERYADPGCEHRTAAHHPITDDTWEWFLDGTDTVFTVEGPYDNRLPKLCAQRGIRLVYHANPELWDERYRGTTTRVWLPTSWEQDRVRDAEVMVMPVDRERCAFRQRTSAATFLFPWGPAFHDRNGLELFLEATGQVRADVRLVIAGLHPPDASHGRVEYLGEVENYWGLYEEADVLVLPRRYGGLSLCIQEAASCGLPIVTLDRPPYGPELHRAGVVPSAGSYPARMRGGRFDVHRCEPRVLAQRIDWLAREPGLVVEMSAASDRFAAGLDWVAHEETWRGRLHRE